MKLNVQLSSKKRSNRMKADLLNPIRFNSLSRRKYLLASFSEYFKC